LHKWLRQSVQQFFNDVYDQCQQYTCNDDGGNREIKTKFFLFNPDITWQPAYPVKFIVKEINHDTNKGNNEAGTNDPFSCYTVHAAKV
jgi:hypothetical protein